MDASIFDSALSDTRRSDALEKEKKIACPLLDVSVCGQVLSPRLYRVRSLVFFSKYPHEIFDITVDCLATHFLSLAFFGVPKTVRIVTCMKIYKLYRITYNI